MGFSLLIGLLPDEHFFSTRFYFVLNVKLPLSSKHIALILNKKKTSRQIARACKRQTAKTGHSKHKVQND